MNLAKSCRTVAIAASLFAPVSFSAQLAPGDISKEALLSLSDSIAFDLGRGYQLGQNCNRELGSISIPKAAGLLINYLDEREVQKVMQRYAAGMKSLEGEKCDSAELRAFMPALQEKLANYVKIATPHTRPYSKC